ncbi:MATE family efflux transporter [Longimicrobium sp.]|uniref:MATE family efflux transporter n=1 Tax=Longimicrobium sp. TaxID=2029185 RepID=UPI002ED7FAAE
MTAVHETPIPGSEPLPRMRTAIAQSLRGAHAHDYTQGPIGRSVLLLAIPMVLEVALESVFALTDIFFVSRLGEASVAAVGLTESMLAIVYALAMGLGMGAAAVVARRVGERDAEGAARSAVQAVAVAAGISLVLGIAGFLLAPWLLAAMGASPEVIRVGTGYARIMLGGQAAVILLFVVNAIFRGAGDPAIAMRVLWLANGINIVLGPLLIFGVGPFPRLGVTGAAVATTFGRSVGAAFALWRLTRPEGHFQVRRRHLRLDPGTMRQIVRLSGSTTLQALIATASWLGLVRIVASFGDPAVAGYTVALRVVVTAILPSWGLSNAAATMVGQALGAGKPDRAERAVWTACRYNLAFLAAVGVLFVALAHPIVGVFTREPEAMRIAVAGLRIIAAGFPLYAFGMVLTQSFNGAGDTWTPTWINLGIFWAFEIPLAYLLAVHLGMGPAGAFTAVTIAFSALAGVSAILFRRGSWKTKRV